MKTSHEFMRFAWILLGVVFACPQAFAQHYVEARGADTKYRYFDWNYTFSNAAIIDVFYVGVPGSNELNLGGGYGFKPRPWLTVSPLLYAVIGKEGSQRGVKMAVLIGAEKNEWKLSSFLAHYARASGDVPRYQVMDTLDVTRAVHGRWELGISHGFFHADGYWNPQVGPLVKVSDRLGFWALSYRFGPQREWRLTRVFLQK